MASAAVVPVKIRFGEEIRRLSSEQGASLEAVLTALVNNYQEASTATAVDDATVQQQKPTSAEYVLVDGAASISTSLAKKFTLKYQDDENDWVTIKTEEEFALAKEIVRSMGKPCLNILVSAAADTAPLEPKEDPKTETTTATNQTPDAAPKSDSKNNHEEFVRGLSNVIESIGVYVDDELIANLENSDVVGSLCKAVQDIFQHPSASTISTAPTASTPNPRCEWSRPPDFARQHYPRRSSAFVHFGICCDGCGANPIVGKRMKCNTCDDYDLCEGCFSRLPEHHDNSHVFQTIDYTSRCGRRYGRGGRCGWSRPEAPVNTPPAAEPTTSPAPTETTTPVPPPTQEEVAASTPTSEKQVEEDITPVLQQEQVVATDSSASAPEEVVATEAPAPTTEEFAGQIAQLRGMGFTDDDANRNLLRACNGDVMVVLNHLLDL